MTGTRSSLVISILLMGVGATLIGKRLESFPIVAFIGVALIVYIGVEMVYEDVHRFTSGGTAHGEYRKAPEPMIRIF